MKPTTSWHAISISVLLDTLQTRKGGLEAHVASERLVKYGTNTLPAPERESLAILFLRQFASPLIGLLLVSSLVMFILNDVTDGSIVLAVLLFNAAIGAYQEGRAQTTLASLHRLLQGSATVIRDGVHLRLPDSQIVPGDCIVVREGERVPADARLIQVNDLSVDESSLTGESYPLSKKVQTLSVDTPLADRRNMLYRGTTVVSGEAIAIVVATGLQTVIGAISSRIETMRSHVPLQAKLQRLSLQIIGAASIAAAVVVILSLLRGDSLLHVFTTAVSLAVAVIPEGLPIVLTLVLAMGVKRMSDRHALVKKLQAVEALSHCDVVAIDKTGTITKNELVIQAVYADQTVHMIAGEGYQTQGFMAVAPPAHLRELAVIAALHAHAEVFYDASNNTWSVVGDPTEAALVVFATKYGALAEDQVGKTPVIAEERFTYRRQYSQVTWQHGSTQQTTRIGAPDVLLRDMRIPAPERRRLEQQLQTWTQEGYRVLAVVSRTSRGPYRFIGLFALQDTLHPEIAETVRRLKEAGIQIMMITGDHIETAKALATQAGIYTPRDELLVGKELGGYRDAELAERLRKTTVVARATPDDKLRIIEVLQRQGLTVAMTGDGINDAPSLVAADLGIAMGRHGTEVAKEAADIVLLDDNLASIEAAVTEGRSIYKTMRNVIFYLLSTSMGEALVLIGALIVSLPQPLEPTHIIWLNFVTDGFLDLALSMEPDHDTKLEATWKKDNQMLSRSSLWRMLVVGVVMMVGTLSVFGYTVSTEPAKALTMSLTTLAIFQWINAWNCRSERRSVFGIPIRTNLWLVGATFVVIGLHLAVLYTPLGALFATVPLSVADWVLAFAVASSILVVEEVRKAFVRRRVQ